VIEAFIEHHILRTPMRDDLPPGEALAAHMRLLVEQYQGWPGRVVAQILGEAQSDTAIGREFRERFSYGRRAVVREVVEKWRAQGGIEKHINIEMLLDILYAPIYMRLMVGHGPLDDKFVANHLAFVYELLGASPPRGTRPKKSARARK
jgi:hypothetical protein